MTLTSLGYALFLLSVIGVYWSAKTLNTRLWALLGASIVFYGLVFYGSLPSATYEPIDRLRGLAYLPLMLVSSLTNFQLGRFLGKDSPLGEQRKDPNLSEEEWHYAQADWNQKRLTILWIGIGLNVILLLGFKYIPFLLATLSYLGNWPQLRILADQLRTSVIAPLGFSFFSFECIAYLVDVYRGAPATSRLLRFTTYRFFFPKLISGPIMGYHAMAKQLQELRFPQTNQLTEALWLIALGAFKKVVLADYLGILVSLSYGNLPRAGSGDIWLATFAYGLQLYLDFSAYVDIARGSAQLLGIALPKNFESPYFTTSIADFWRRWHMTLGNWLRNYLYFPLGGSRQGLKRTCFNLFIVMVVAGLWHGANWGFVVWGVLHGLALVCHRLMVELGQRLEWVQRWWRSLLGTCVAWVLTQMFVFMAWIFFRLPNLSESWWAFTHLVGHGADIQFAQKVYLDVSGLDRLQITILMALLVAVMGLFYGLKRATQLQLNWPVKLVLTPLCLYAILQLAPQGSLPYIYFDF
jgi:alginate O-acetyltransferase complex protein AlgI